ncbi:hypothetical protein OQA88_11670 [Cercophora sp. LCS_1]
MNHHETNHRPESPRGLIGDITKDINLGEEIDLVVGVTATALAADQALKMSKSKDHKAAHFAKASLGAAVATTAFTMMAREHREKKKHIAKTKQEERERGRLPYRERDVEMGYAESLTDSSDDEHMAVVPHTRFERGTSLHGSEYRHRSRSPSRSRSRTPPPRARSQASMRQQRKRSESPSGFVKFLQAVRDGMEENQRQRHS